MARAKCKTRARAKVKIRAGARVRVKTRSKARAGANAGYAWQGLELCWMKHPWTVPGIANTTLDSEIRLRNLTRILSPYGIVAIHDLTFTCLTL